MKLLRFMSAHEAIKLLDGKTLRNSTDHHLDDGQATDSIGFCFAIVDNRFTLDTSAIYEAAHRLSGVAIMDICLVATAEKLPKRYVKSWGHYKGGKLPEYSTEQYGLKDFREWAFYAPHDRSGLLPVFSGNWEHPRLSTKKEI